MKNGGATMRVMGWNFLEGGLGAPDAQGRRSPRPERRAAALALVERARPDVLVLNEALGCDLPGDAAQDYAKIFGFEHGRHATYEGIWGNAILSRWPILEVRASLIHKHGPQNRGLLAVKVAFPEGDAWVATYHPHPWREPSKRAEDLREFLASLGGPAIVCGDFNAIDPADEIDEENLVQAHRRFMSEKNARDSVRRFREAGRLVFGEVFPALGFSPATPVERAATMPTALVRHEQDKGMRIDHVAASAHWRCLRAWVDRSAEADAASDHYPVVAEFAVAETTPEARLAVFARQRDEADESALDAEASAPA
jgi:endonuclease/exonuclease/phosphatase family metal-dependent hydrolase